MTHFEQQTQELESCQTPDDHVHTVGKWMHVVPHLDPKYGGMSATVPQLSDALRLTQNVSVNIAAFCQSSEASQAPLQPELPLTFWPASRGQWFRSSSLREQFRSAVRAVDGVHLHGLWETSTAVAASTAHSVKKPYVVSAHGMLEPWALANKRFKKHVYSALIERLNVNRAACLHGLTISEAEDYRHFGSTRPIAIIPNGVKVPERIDESLFFNIFPGLVGRRIVLFLGRIHFKKGLDILIHAWAEIAKQFPDAVLVLAGPDLENFEKSINKLVTDYGINTQVVFTGMLAQPLKWSALASAHCFVLPSYSEGLSVAVLEAMSMGLPVIISEHCNLPEVKTFGAGWVIKANVQELRIVLQDMLHNRPSTNHAIGNCGRELVDKRFTWAAVADQMADLYAWLQGGPLPQSFELMGVPA